MDSLTSSALRLTEPAQVKSHPYFKGIDWEKLLQKEIKPPFIPPVKNKQDVSMVYPELLEEKPILEASKNIKPEFQQKFESFGKMVQK